MRSGGAAAVDPMRPVSFEKSCRSKPRSESIGLNDAKPNIKRRNRVPPNRVLHSLR